MPLFLFGVTYYRKYAFPKTTLISLGPGLMIWTDDGVILIPVWMSNYLHYKVWDDIIHTRIHSNEFIKGWRKLFYASSYSKET